MLTKKDVHHWMVQSVSCCHNLDLTIFILNLRNVLVDEIPDRITKSQLKQTNLRRIQVLIICLASWVGKMNQILHCDWLPEWARWTKSSTVIGHLSGQDEPNPPLWLVTRVGKMTLSCSLRTTHWVPQEKFSWKPYLNKSFIDQACLVKMDISLVHFLRVYGPWLCLHP